MNGKRIMQLALVTTTLIMLALEPAFALKSDLSQEPDGLFTVKTSDGVTLKMRRYRPSPDAPYREGAQPVLMFSGIILNMNEFLIYTPEEKKAEYADVKIENMAPWAIGDPYIEKDPMMYYNLGYYLYKLGYDPWFLNYRGTGVGPFKSEVGDWGVSLDTWAMLDVPAAIDKVTKVTGISPIIGGHSTGGFVSYAYLQGTYFEDGPGSHVRSDPELARERNEAIKGVIAIDPAGRPPIPLLMDLLPVWLVLGLPLYIDIRGLFLETFGGTLADLFSLLIPTMLGLLNTMNVFLGGDSLLSILDFWNGRNTSPELEDFMMHYVFDSTYLWGFGQYFDFGLHHTLREFWKNGPENAGKMTPPSPDPGNDGYYYYDENMKLVTAPFITLLSEADGLVSARNMIIDLVQGKTSNPLDETYIIEGTAHIDIAMGSGTPTEVFPKIGAWLTELLPQGPQVVAIE
jgi:pimeloyl-ACP methyl ester carboxylesterase